MTNNSVCVYFLQKISLLAMSMAPQNMQFGLISGENTEKTTSGLQPERELGRGPFITKQADRKCAMQRSLPLMLLL